MKTIADALSKELTEDLEWREAELAIMRKQLLLTSPKSLQERVLLRASLAMIYAHYEGFCKFALDLYLDYLEKLGLKITQLSWPLSALALQSFQNELRSGSLNSKAFFEKLFFEFNDRLHQEARYGRPPQIANLWPELLSEWLVKLGLPSKETDAGRTSLDSLVQNRNHIAHGKKLSIADPAALDAYAHIALLAMHEVAVGMVSSFDTKSYRRTAATSTQLNHSAL